MTAQLLFKLKQYLVHAIAAFDSVYFYLRFEYLKWKYDGRKNIPPEKLRRMIESTRPEKLKAPIRLIFALQQVTEVLRIDRYATKTRALISRGVNNEIDTLDEFEAFKALVTSARPRRQLILDTLLAFNDIEEHQVVWRSADAGYSKEAFAAWLTASDNAVILEN